ncbi:MAG: stage II sporulation protein P [Clostridia bacterium]|nr:stage II sporulation protein P [Clostridia bacterium]
MIRISVVSTRDVVRKSIKIISIVVLLIVIIYIVKFSNKHLNKIELNSKMALSYISEEITMLGDFNDIDFSRVYPEQILSKELGFSYVSKVEEQEIEVDDNEEKNTEEQEVIPTNNIEDESNNQEHVADMSDIPENQSTELIPSSYKQTYNFEVEGVKIKNESKYDLDTFNLSSSNVCITSKDIIIFHTHTCESYTQTENSQYEASGNYRTTDLSHSVAHVGDVLESYLKSFGYNVIHDKTYHDYPAYNGSYGRSLKTVSSLIQKNKDVEIIIDLHRDAMSDETYAPKVKIGDEYAAQIMFVIGTDGSGLTHDNWRKNLEYAIKVQKIGNEMYPGLFKPIIVRNARYNQNLSKAATIIEFGATGNTLEECEVSAKYLAKVLDKVVEQ